MASDDDPDDGLAGGDSPRVEQNADANDRSLSDGKHVAVRLLGGREHARGELIRKLTQRGWSDAQSEQILEELVELGLQSDERFAESFVRTRVQKAYGPVRIRAELQQRGIDRAVIEQALRSEAPDWLAVASQWYARRYGSAAIDDRKERSKRQNALARRGFTTEVIRELVN